MPKLQPVNDEIVTYQGRMLEVVNQDMTDGAKTITFEWARRAPGVRLIIVDEDKQTVCSLKSTGMSLALTTSDFLVARCSMHLMNTTHS